MRVIRGAWSDETDACAGKAKQPIALVEAKADCVTERDRQIYNIKIYFKVEKIISMK